MYPEVYPAVSHKYSPEVDENRKNRIAESLCRHYGYGKARCAVSGKCAVESAAIIVHDMHNRLYIGRMRGPQFLKAVFEDIANLIGKHNRESYCGKKDKHILKAETPVNEIEDKEIQRYPYSLARRQPEHCVGNASHISVQVEEQGFVQFSDKFYHLSVIEASISVKSEIIIS